MSFQEHDSFPQAEHTNQAGVEKNKKKPAIPFAFIRKIAGNPPYFLADL